MLVSILPFLPLCVWACYIFYFYACFDLTFKVVGILPLCLWGILPCLLLWLCGSNFSYLYACEELALCSGALQTSPNKPFLKLISWTPCFLVSAFPPVFGRVSTEKRVSRLLQVKERKCRCHIWHLGFTIWLQAVSLVLQRVDIFFILAHELKHMARSAHACSVLAFDVDIWMPTSVLMCMFVNGDVWR